MILKYRCIKANLYLVFAITFCQKCILTHKPLVLAMKASQWLHVELLGNRQKQTEGISFARQRMT